MGPDDKHGKPTVRMTPRDLAGSGSAAWPLVIASLERLNDWGIMAMRLGTLALLQECVRQMALPTAGAEYVTRARELVEALAHLPWEPR